MESNKSLKQIESDIVKQIFDIGSCKEEQLRLLLYPSTFIASRKKNYPRDQLSNERNGIKSGLDTLVGQGILIKSEYYCLSKSGVDIAKSISICIDDNKENDLILIPKTNPNLIEFWDVYLDLQISLNIATKFINIECKSYKIHDLVKPLIREGLEQYPMAALQVFNPVSNTLLMHCWIDYVSDNEKLGKLILKFLNYRGIADSDWNRKDKQLPDNILTYSTENFRDLGNKWAMYLEAYLLGMANYSQRFNMVLCNQETLIEMLQSRIDLQLMSDKLHTIIKMQTEGKKCEVDFDTSKMEAAAMYVLSWKPIFTMSYSESNVNTIYLYLKMDGYETCGISQLIDFHLHLDELREMCLDSVYNIIPIFYYSIIEPTLHSLTGLNNLYGHLIRHCRLRIPADPDTYSGGIRTANRKHPDTLSSDLILR